MGAEGRADGNEWEKGSEMEGEGQESKLEIPKRNVLDVEGRHVPLSTLVYFFNVFIFN